MSVQKKIEGLRRIGAPLRFPAPPHQGMAGHGPLSESSRNDKRRVRYPRRHGAGPGGLRRLQGPAGFAKGRCPLASAHSRMSNTGVSVAGLGVHPAVPFRVLWSAGGEAGRPVVSALGMVRGQFRFGHWSPWMAAATMAARLHSSSTASARITASMARSSPIHHSM